MVRWEDPLLARCIPAIADRAGRRAAQKLQSEYIGCRCDGGVHINEEKRAVTLLTCCNLCKI